MNKKIKMTIEMNVTIPQALALREMFNYWSYLGNIGLSKFVAFYVDGDGDFQPCCKITTSKQIPDSNDEIKLTSIISDNGQMKKYDFDGLKHYCEDK